MQQIAKPVFGNFQAHLKAYTQEWLTTLLTGIFLFVVLFLFKAYDIQQGVSSSGHGLLFRAFVFGLGTSLVFGLHEFGVRPYIQLDTKQKRFLWRCWEVFVGMNMTFLLFNYFWNWKELYWYGYFLLLMEYSLVMLIPLAFIALKFPKEVTSKSVTQELLTFQTEGGKDKLQIKPTTLLYIKSEDNYVKVFYEAGSDVKSILIRTSLKSIEQQHHAHPNLKRCHRSYMVNPEKVVEVIYESRQIRLAIGLEETIPVSKKYQAVFEAS